MFTKEMKKLWRPITLCTLALCLSVIGILISVRISNASTLTSMEGFLYTINSESGTPEITIVGYEGLDSAEEIIIPEFINGHPVTIIDEFAFSKIMPVIVSWGEELIWGKNEKLKKVTIPNTIHTIKRYAFGACLNLEEVKFSENSSLVSIENSAFESCKSLISIEFPSTTEIIKEYAFSGCSSLESVTFAPRNQNGSILNIFIYAFAHCVGLDNSGLRNIELPAFVRLEEGVFFNTGLDNITVSPDNPTLKVENDCLIRTTDNTVIASNNVKSIVIPNYVTKLGLGAFTKDLDYVEGNKIWNNKLEQIIIPNSVTSIGDCAFYQAYSLKHVSIPSSVKLIDRRAFYQCKSLKNVFIPNSVETAGLEAFGYSPNLTIYVETSNISDLWHENWNPLNIPVVLSAKAATLYYGLPVENPEISANINDSVPHIVWGFKKSSGGVHNLFKLPALETLDLSILGYDFRGWQSSNNKWTTGYDVEVEYLFDQSLWSENHLSLFAIWAETGSGSESELSLAKQQELLSQYIWNVEQLTSEQFPPKTWEAVQEAFEYAINIVNNPERSSEISMALVLIKNAFDNLADISALSAKVDEINGLNLNSIEFTEESWSDFLDKLKIAEDLLENATSEAEVEDALLALNNALGALEQKTYSTEEPKNDIDDNKADNTILYVVASAIMLAMICVLLYPFFRKTPVPKV